MARAMANFGDSRSRVAYRAAQHFVGRTAMVRKMTVISEWLNCIGSTVDAFCNNNKGPKSGFLGARAR